MVKKSRLQLLAATCLHIASKLEDEGAVNASELHYCADRTFDTEDITRQEEDILDQIHWNISCPTIHDFVSLYQGYLGEPNGVCYWMTQYISEFALQSTLFLNYPPSLIGASVIAFSRYCVYKTNSYPSELENLSGYKFFQDLGECIIDLSTFIRNRNSDLKIISNRYKKVEHGRVSKITLCDIKTSIDLEKMK